VRDISFVKRYFVIVDISSSSLNAIRSTVMSNSQNVLTPFIQDWLLREHNKVDFDWVVTDIGFVRYWEISSWHILSQCLYLSPLLVPPIDYGQLLFQIFNLSNHRKLSF
jgi:hypothetical protein